jgi:putative heme-binding domain-containing protein
VPSLPALLLLCACSPAAPAVTGSQAGPPAGEEHSLFDGRSLAGWEGDTRFWTVEDGELVGRSSAATPLERTTYLTWTGGELRDFELTLQYRLVAGNSGVQFRSRPAGRFNVAGYQADIADGQGLSGGLYEQFGRGFLARPGEEARYEASGQRSARRFEQEPVVAGRVRKSQWNELSIRAVGARIEVRLNGAPSSVLEDHAAQRACLSGQLALQLHAGPPMEVRFRDLRLVDLGGVHDQRVRSDPLWIWTRERAEPGEEAWFQREFELPARPRRATLYAAADDGFELHLNGALVAAGEGTDRLQQVELGERLCAGPNRIAAWAHNEDGPAAFYAALNVVGDGWQLLLGTDAAWLGATREPPDWTVAGGAGAPWGPVEGFGPLGTEPWGRPPYLIKDAPLQALAGEALELPEGFAAELVYSVPRARQGSWVALCSAPGGLLYAADQFGALYRIEPPPAGAPGQRPRVERVPVELGEAQGLVWAFDALYVVVNGSERFASGLYRASDADGDGRLDQSECLRAFEGSGEHGPHAVLLAPDGRSLLVLGGNEVAPPAEALAAWGPSFLPVGVLPVRSLAVEMGQYDLALQGAAGWVCRTDARGERWELVAYGLRNAYDGAFDRSGELYVFDSDMEWDLGLPWYVPTRLLHVVERADFGFRLGSARWPTWFPDSLPALVECGRASPTGMLAARELDFPAPWRETLLAGDWLKGRILAFTLEPTPEGTRARWEVFAAGRPLPVTDLAAGADGALYFTTGGRHVQSGLYRIAYRGERSSGPHDDKTSAAGPSAAERRHALRQALDSRPVEAWTEPERSQLEPVELWLVRARVAPANQLDALLAELVRSPLDPRDERGTLTTLRALEVALLRWPKPEPAIRALVAGRLLDVFPRGSRELDRQLGVILASLPEAEERFVPLALERLVAAGDPAEAFHWAFLLRHARRGWTLAGRRTLLEWLRAAEQGFGGGRAVPVYLEGLRRDLVATLSAGERPALADLLTPGTPDLAPASTRRFVRSWSLADLEPVLGELEGERDLGRGAALLREASCLACHRLDGRGSAQGPELDGLGGRFSARDLFESILDPSADVPERYRDTWITTADERLHAGRIVGADGEDLLLRESHGRREVVRIPRAEIVAQQPSPTSPMPEGLLDAFTLEEILDLGAYLLQDAP